MLSGMHDISTLILSKQIEGKKFVSKRHKFHDGRAKSDITSASFAQNASERRKK